MVRRSKNLETGVLIRMQRPRARLGTNRRPPSRIDHARPYAAFHFDFRSAGIERSQGFDREMRTIPIDGWWIAGREGICPLVASPRVALRYVALRTSNGFVSNRIVSKNK